MPVRPLAMVPILAGIPLAMLACALLGWWLGSLLDRALSTGIAFQILMPLLFVAGSFRETIKLLRRSSGAGG